MASLGALPALDIAKMPDPLDSATKLMGLQGTMQQQQLGKIQIAQAQKTQQDQAALGQLMIKHQGNLDKVIQDAPSAGIQPKTVIELQQHVLDVKQKTAELVKSQGAIAAQHADLMAGAHDAVTKAPPEQKSAVYKGQLQALKDQGVDTSQMPPDYLGDDQFKFLGAVVQGHKQLVENAISQQKADAETMAAQARKTAAERGPEGEMPLGAPRVAQLNQMMEQRWQVLHPGQPLFPTYKLPDTATQKDFDRTDKMMEGEEKAISGQQNHQDSMGIRNAMLAIAKGNAQAPKGEGGQPSAVAQGIADGSMKWGDVVSARTPMNVRESLLKEIKGINPDFNSGDFDVEKKVKIDLTSGGKSNTLLAYNTALKHIDTFGALADRIDNGNMKGLNTIGNFLDTQFGSDKQTNLQLAKSLLSGEVAKAAAGVNSTGEERAHFDKIIADASSPTQFKGAVATIRQLLEGKREAMAHQAVQGLKGKADFGGDKPKDFGAAPAGAVEGHTGTAADGTKVIVKGGRIVAQ